MFKMTSGGNGGSGFGTTGTPGAGGVGFGSPGGNASGAGGGGGPGGVGGVGAGGAGPGADLGQDAGFFDGGGGGTIGKALIAFLSYDNVSSTVGGNGGLGGEPANTPAGADFGGGGGGAGGFGLLIENSAPSITISNESLIAGGNGGNGGHGGVIFGSGGGGGDGGIGLLVLDTVAAIITNSGTITGGNGGAGGADFSSGGLGHGPAGAGGAGIAGANLQITDSGIIAGGFSGDAVPVQADAIDFIGGVNSLTLQDGANISGNVVAFSSADSVVFNFAANTTLDVSVNQFQGFGSHQQSGQSASATLTLINITSADTPWTINSGVLAVSSDGNLGNDTNSTIDELSFDGGTLQFLADGFSTGRQIVLNANGTFDTNGHNATLGGLISGNGELIKIDAGVLTLSHSNAYSGGTLINGGTLDLAALGAAGAGQITFGTGSQILKIENAALSPVTNTINTFGNPIQGIGVGDIIDLTGLTFAKGAKVSYNPNTDQLAVTSGGVTDALTAVLAPQGATFALSSDGANGTDITVVGVAHGGHGHG
jgi:autotransporter-associated beta strand protein